MELSVVIQWSCLRKDAFPSQLKIRNFNNDMILTMKDLQDICRLHKARIRHLSLDSRIS